MADPFDFANADAPAPAGGMSPDFWHNLQMFGGALAAGANARNGQGFLTYGPDFAGPFGAALMQTGQQSLETAKTKAGLGLTSANIADVRSQAAQRNIANKMALYNLNLNSQLYGGPQYDANGNALPTGTPGPMQDQGGGAPQAQAQPAAASPGPASFTGGAGVIASNPAIQPIVASTAAKYGIPAPLATAMLQQESSMGTNPAAKGNIGQITFKTASNPGYGMQPLAGADLTDPQKNIDFSLQYLRKAGDQAGVTNWNDPSQWGVALHAYNGGGDPNYVQNVARWLPKDAQVGGGAVPFQVAQAGGGPIPMPGQPTQLAPQPGPGQPQQQQAPMMNPLGLASGILRGQIPLQQVTPDQAFAAAPLISRVNPQLGQELMKYGLAGQTTASQKQVELQYAAPIAGATTAAQHGAGLPFVGPETAAKASNENVDARPGGLMRIQTPNGPQWVKNPALESVQNADGTTSYVHVSPPMPGSPEGTPGTSTPVVDAGGSPVVEKIAPQIQHARDKAYTDFSGKDADSYLAAQNTQAWLEQMDHAAETLNAGGGFLQTGPTSPARISFANTVNDILRTSGLPNAFDPNKIGSWEELKKATTTAGFELSSHYEGHARQAAQTIVNATSAVPSAENTPVGFHIVSAGIREASQSAIDLRQALQPVYDAGGDLTKAETQFYQQNPAPMYARRAISTVTPYPVKTDAELKRYLPGTVVIYKGKPVQVPERPGAPPVPEYLKNLQLPPQQAAAP